MQNNLPKLQACGQYTCAQVPSGWGRAGCPPALRVAGLTWKASSEPCLLQACGQHASWCQVAGVSGMPMEYPVLSVWRGDGWSSQVSAEVETKSTGSTRNSAGFPWTGSRSLECGGHQECWES
uniref:Uncharacterized protein n=1 Tax=Pipistrellus kuhlii TaxID=59472 RepID=A0A7J8A8D8_PIPKU|nr:hypothetical protein mPipKuh1_008897 [Pipistrellus kuhlii]